MEESSVDTPGPQQAKPEPKQKQSDRTSKAECRSLQEHSVEAKPAPRGLLSKIGRKLFRKRPIKVIPSECKSEKEVSCRSADAIIFNKNEDPVRTVEIFEAWGRALSESESIDAFLEKLGLLEMGEDGKARITYKHLLRLQLFSEKIRALEHNNVFRKMLGVEGREDAYRAFSWIESHVVAEHFQARVASVLLDISASEGEALCEQGIPTRTILGAVLFFKLAGEVELIPEGIERGGPIALSPYALVSSSLLPFAENKEVASGVLDSVARLKNTAFDEGSADPSAFVLSVPQDGDARVYGAGGFGSETGDYLWEDLALVADSIQEYSGLSKSMDDRAIAGALRSYACDYFNRADLNFITVSGPVRTYAGELLSKVFLEKLSLGQLAAVLPEDTFTSLKKIILTNFKAHEPYLDRASIQKHFSDEAANALIFGTTFFDRERVNTGLGSMIQVTPSEAQLKAFCKEVMSSDDYEQIVENKLYPPSPVDLMRELKPEAIVELFNRNGVWANYTDAQIEKMLPEGVAIRDILDARDAG